MANTERMQIIKIVREAKLQVAESRKRKDLNVAQKKKLKEIYLIIDALEDDLILKEVAQNVEGLEKASEGLLALNSEIKEDIKDIEKVSEYIEKAAKGVGILVKVLTTVAKLPM